MLSRWGDGYPTISVHIRHWNGGQGQRFSERLSLSLNDAPDLVTVPQHLIAQVDADRVLNDSARNAFNLGVDAGAYGLVPPSRPADEAAGATSGDN